MTCKDCIHAEVCVGYEVTMPECEHFADKSLYIKLPCKVGDTVYCVFCRWGTKWYISESKVWGISVEHTNKVRQFYIKYRSKDYDGRTENATGMLGSMVFLTREEAEAALKEREK